VQADKRISKKTQKKTRGKTTQEQNTNGKYAECGHVEKGSEKKNSEAESLNI
jgi:hypothetical protein